MSPNIHPLLLSDTLHLVLNRLAIKDLEKAQLICREWKGASSVLYAQRLKKEFNISHHTVLSLCAPQVVYYRLKKVMERGKDKRLDERDLYRSYITAECIDETVVHLMDHDAQWFEGYLTNRDAFFRKKCFDTCASSAIPF